MNRYPKGLFGSLPNLSFFARMSLLLGSSLFIAAQASAIPAKKDNSTRQAYKIYVDKNGVMRRSDNNKEVSYYGTNYTAPFAYSYRELGRLGKDRREAIDKDVYHIARLGLNAFRLHLWDAELADSAGNLIDNDHLDLLDYMIAAFEKRGIDIILTAQTNFGNGYPEKNIDTGAFTYDFDKCQIHDDPQAQKIQENYLSQLARHVNPYTGRSYAGDNAIIAMEINNEPCHSGTKKEVTAYINRMVKALRKAGFEKPLLYNVTHNPDVTSAYYDADIQGTTYQWYPTGLVAGHERKGNFQPMLDNYTIPWKDTMPRYNKLARVVYEFDPADVTYSHLYPAIARTFRKEGFQWITQFAYDPLYLAQYNTEYPTHFLSLVYTPAKALSMMVAANAAYEIPRGADYGQYPQNSTFEHTRVNYEQDLSEYNSPQKFIYSNNTTSVPYNADSLQLVAGHGNSQLVEYAGNGAYFLDRVSPEGVWRLEVMPDVAQISDPFTNTDICDSKVVATSRNRKMKIMLPKLGKDYNFIGLNDGNSAKGTARDAEIAIEPGTYLIYPQGMPVPDRRLMHRAKVAGNIGLFEYAAPDYDRAPVALMLPKDADRNVDICQIPEAWDYKLEKLNLGWDMPPVYSLTSEPKQDGKIVMRRFVGDQMQKLPENVKATKLNAKLMTDAAGKTATAIPEGSRISLVCRDGATYSAPFTPAKDGTFSVALDQLKPTEGIIMPAPYPTMLTRTIPEGGTSVNRASDIEFVELVIPQKKGDNQQFLIQKIWVD